MNKNYSHHSKTEISYNLNAYDVTICFLSYIVAYISGSYFILYFGIMYTIYTLISGFDIYYEKEMHKNEDYSESKSEESKINELKEEYSTKRDMTEEEFEDNLEEILLEN